MKPKTLLHAGIMAGLLVSLAVPALAQPLPAGFHDRTFPANRPLDGGESSEPWTVPGVAATVPTGLGLGWGELFAAATYQATTPYGDEAVGVTGAGFGLGDAERWVSLQVAVNSFSTISTGFLKRGAVDLHLSRTLPNDFHVGVGWEGVHRWGSPRASSSGYAVISRWFDLQADVPTHLGQGMVTLGVGSSRFQSEDNIREGLDRVGLFASTSLRIAAPLAVIAEWTGQNVFLGASVTPFQTRRIAVTAGLADVTGSGGDGSRFIVGSSMVLRPLRTP